LTTLRGRRTAGRWVRAGLFAGGLAAALILAEGLARLQLPTPQTVQILADPNAARRLEEERRSPADLSVPRHPEQATLYVETPTGRRLRADTHLRIENHDLSKRTIDIVTNSIGYRNREIGPKTGTRILFLGDSITFADYQPEDETFVRQIEMLARQQGENWETINAGVGAVSLATELAILTETGLALAPDAVVLDFYLNDYADSPGVRVPQLPSLVRRSRLLSTLWPIGWRWFPSRSVNDRDADVVARFAERRSSFEARARARGDRGAERAAFDALVAQHFADWGGAWSPEAWRDMEPLFRELARLAERHRFKLFLVMFPVRYQVDATFVPDEPQQRFQEMARALGVPSLDLLPFLREQARLSGEPLFYDHCHHTARGSRVIAERIWAFLQPNLE
jgi:hypothetical protein